MTSLSKNINKNNYIYNDIFDKILKDFLNRKIHSKMK